VFRRVFSPSAAQYNGLAETTDLLTSARSAYLRAFQVNRANGTTGEEGNKPTGDIWLYRVPPGEKNWVRKKDGTGRLANITETTVNNEFREFRTAIPVQRSPTNSPDEGKFKLAVDAVQQCNGNKTLAAQSLSITRAYLHRLLRQPGGSPTVVIAEIPSRTSGLPVAAGE
jgi:hypothetical protein